jgi:outer membrane protein assembly factor BamA
MRGTRFTGFWLWALGLGLAIIVSLPAAAHAQETITEIRVHGNHTTPDADIIGLSGLEPGDPATDARLAEAEEALRKSNRFDDVELRKRFRSIDNPADILIMIVIDERSGVSADDLTPGFGARMRDAMLWWPIFNYADGYGFTYGLRPAFADPIGADSVLSFPLSWGGERRAGVELEKLFDNQRTRAGVAFAVNRRVNPFFDVSDLRQQLRVETDHAIIPWMRVGAGARLANVDFGDAYDQRHIAAGAHVTFDTRIDPLFPRNAVHARLDWRHVDFETGSAGVFETDARLYVGVTRRAVVALRGQLVRSDGPLPQAEQSLLGGYDSLRGYRTGHRAGDSLAAMSAELRVPISSPLRVSQLGVKAFIDAGTVWNAGTRLADQTFERGIGTGVFLGAAVLRLDLDLAWPEDGKPRVHFALGVSF